MDKRTFPLVGVSSLLVIFSVLCLTVFALLSVSAVQADQALRSRTAQAVEGYYMADCAAHETLARLRAGDIPPGVEENEGVFSYTHPISDTQQLAVTVAVSGKDYTVLRWQAVSTAAWNAGEHLPVWDGEVKEEF